MQTGELVTSALTLCPGVGDEATQHPSAVHPGSGVRTEPTIGDGGSGQSEVGAGRGYGGRRPYGGTSPTLDIAGSEWQQVECVGEQHGSPLHSGAITPEWVKEFWRCKPWLLEALEYNGGTHSLGDVFRGIAEGRYQFWPAATCVLVSEILVFPQRKTFNYFLVGGDGNAEMQVMVPYAEAWARAQGCESVTLCGRRGWERQKWLKDFGYKMVQVFISKEL